VKKMAEKTRRKTVDKWKKKKWFVIKASKIFDSKNLGETPAEKPVHLTNRVISVKMDRLTGQRNKRDITIFFKTDDVQGQTINTKISKFEIARSSIGRMVRRRNTKVAVVEKIPVEGGEAKTTFVVVTVRKATNAQKASIREIVQKNLFKLKTKDFEEVVKELLLGQFSAKVFKDVSKIVPVKKAIVSKSVFKEAK
jgi:small subunit ribosomal protein S3Ae